MWPSSTGVAVSDPPTLFMKISLSSLSLVVKSIFELMNGNSALSIKALRIGSPLSNSWFPKVMASYPM
ncbi:hypothetical protein D3C81_2211310 [compost metagenome]